MGTIFRVAAAIYVAIDIAIDIAIYIAVNVARNIIIAVKICPRRPTINLNKNE